MKNTIQKRACFTGHRPEKLHRSDTEITVELEKQIDQAISNGICEFICGMARGVDLWAAQIVITRKRKDENIKLICAVPYRFFSEKWSKYWRNVYESVLLEADTIYHIRDKFCYSSFFERNKWMVDNSSVVIAVYNGTTGGTKNTLVYAEKSNKSICIIPG